MMKSKRNVFLFAIFILALTGCKPKTLIETIEVSGNCESCKNRIEKAALENEGVTFALWDIKSRELVVTYDPKKTSTQQIQTSIAIAGHDTQLFAANDQKYNQLPDCCKYERMNSERSNIHADQHFPLKQDSSSGGCCESPVDK